MKFVDVILPLPLEGVFTYAVPDGMEALVKPGVRLLVPLGKSKTYTGIANAVHDHEPRFEVRDVIAVLDEGQPMLLSRQLRLWQWIADYYMAPVGEVYKAAFPSGLKAEDGYRPKTETFVALSPKYRHEEALRIALSMFGRARSSRRCFSIISPSLTGIPSRVLNPRRRSAKYRPRSS